MESVSTDSADLRPPPFFWGLATGAVIVLAIVGLVRVWSGEEISEVQLPMALPVVSQQAPAAPTAPTAPAAPAGPSLADQRALFAAQLAEAEAEWARRLELARAGSDEAQRAALQALDDQHQADLARERERHAAELEQARSDAVVFYEWPSVPPSVELPPPALPTAMPEPAVAPPPPTDSLLKRAGSTEVALALGPFLEPGFAQLDNSFSKSPLPFSYSQLAATGALKPDPAGWRTLYKIASSRRDRARTRWAADPNEDNLAAAEHAQALLVELGPALVQLGKLRP